MWPADASIRCLGQHLPVEAVAGIGRNQHTATAATDVDPRHQLATAFAKLALAV
jgi:hypothetical protein